VGFAKPNDLVRIAVAPAFDRHTAHREIARRVLEPPVSDWQRPLDETRVETIRDVFDNEQNLMPNPVLLSANIDAGPVDPQPVLGSSGVPTGHSKIVVSIPGPGEPSPLWILDGQHRINGLALSVQKENPIPIVLLVNPGTTVVYTGRDFAHIFAQVTVTSQALDPIHEEWLTYAYEIGSYSEDEEPEVELHRAAFEAASHLCGDSAFPDVSSNAWLNGVRFNPELEAAAGTELEGFRYSVVEMKALLFKRYFQPAATLGTTLDAAEVAGQISAAYAALVATVPEPHSETVFFGAASHSHKALQDGFLIGVLARLASVGAPKSWEQVLRTLRVDETDWNFSSWVTTTGGSAGNVSRKIAEAVFARALREGDLPEQVDNLADFLKGNRSEVVLVCSDVTPAGRPSQSDKLVIKLARGDSISRDVGEKRHVKVLQPGQSYGDEGTTENIGKIDVYDALARGRPRRFAELTGRGLVLGPQFGGNELELSFDLEHYGDARSNPTLKLKWRN
jgi:hypothetical protein